MLEDNGGGKINEVIFLLCFFAFYHDVILIIG